MQHEPERLMKFSFYIALLALQLVDYATTLYILKNGGRELNPLLARLFRTIGPQAGLLIAKAALVVGLAWQYGALAWWVFAALVVLYVFVALGNARAAITIHQSKGSK